MNQQNKESLILIGGLILFWVVLLSTAWYADGDRIPKWQCDAVQAGAGEWVAGENGEPVFQFVAKTEQGGE